MGTSLKNCRSPLFYSNPWWHTCSPCLQRLRACNEDPHALSSFYFPSKCHGFFERLHATAQRITLRDLTARWNRRGVGGLERGIRSNGRILPTKRALPSSWYRFLPVNMSLCTLEDPSSIQKYSSGIRTHPPPNTLVAFKKEDIGEMWDEPERVIA